MSCPYQCSHEVEQMCRVAKGAKHGPAPIPEEGKWVKSTQITDVSGLTHGVGWCAPQQGACKLTLNVKDGVIQEALVETLGCSGMTHSAAMAAEILPGKTILEALNSDLVCDAINVAMRELFKQIVYGRTQTAFSEGGLPIGAGLEDLGKGLRSQVGTMFSTLEKGRPLPRNGRGLRARNRSRREQRDHRLQVRPPRQDDGSDPQGRRTRGSLTRPMSRATAVSTKPSKRSTRARNKEFDIMSVQFEGYERRIAKIEKCAERVRHRIARSRPATSASPRA